MLRFLERIYDFWHNSVLLFVYQLLEERLTSDRQREVVLHIVIISFLLVFSIAAYIVFHRFIDSQNGTVGRAPDNFVVSQEMRDMTVNEVPLRSGAE